MEIRPGRGIDGLMLGELRATVQSRLGPPSQAAADADFYGDVVVRYDDSGIVELIEIPYATTPANGATLHGVRLTSRPMEDVVSDLVSLGLAARPVDTGFDFEPGFSVWSTGSVTVRDTDPAASEDDNRLVVEGVSIGHPAYFGFGS